MTLTTDQRWLIAGLGGWMAADALLGDGITGIGGSSSGMITRTTLTYPQWLRQGYGYDNGHINSPWSAGHTDAHPVKVTRAQLAAFAAQIPAPAAERLRAVRDAHHTEGMVGRDWCLCGKTPCVRDGWGGVTALDNKHHPTDDEYQEHLHRSRHLADDLQAAIEHALGLDVGEQLDLFAEAP